jgi:hypothetical protein
MNRENLEDLVLKTFSKHVSIDQETLIAQNMSMSSILETSDKLVNSVDLMEAFAATSNSLYREIKIKVKLPVLPLSTPIIDVLGMFVDQAMEQMGDSHELA